MRDDGMVKVVLHQVYDDPEEECVTETPWALPLGDNRYQLKNFPWYYYGVSFDDIFEAQPLGDDPRPHLTRVLEKSGNRTLRILLPDEPESASRAESILQTLRDMGCGYEGDGGGIFFAVNVQPHCGFDAVCEFLDNSDVDWEHADPTYESLYPD